MAVKSIPISAFRPDPDVAAAILANPLLKPLVEELVWDYSIIGRGWSAINGFTDLLAYRSGRNGRPSFPLYATMRGS